MAETGNRDAYLGEPTHILRPGGFQICPRGTAPSTPRVSRHDPRQANWPTVQHVLLDKQSFTLPPIRNHYIGGRHSRGT